MGRLVLGLDIGITSVGYGVIDIDNNQFVDYGVRLFKEGTAASNEERRTKRGARRLKRRKTNRLDDMRKLLKQNGLLSEKYVSFQNPYEVRMKGLTQKLTNDELCCAILHITKSRGTVLEISADASKDEETTKAVLSKNAALLKEHFVCEIQLERLEKEGRIRGIDNNFQTKDYLHELSTILDHQDLEDDLKQQILQIVARRRRYDQGPGSEKSPTPYGSYRIVDDELVHVNLIDMMRGRCSVYPNEFRAPKQSYTAELFNLLNDLNNLTINNEKISLDDKEQVIQFVNEKGNITVKQLCKLLNVTEDEIKGFRIDKNEKPILTEFKGYKKVLSIFKNHHLENIIEDKTIVDEIMDINTKTKGIDERKESIQQMYPSLPEEVTNDLANMKGVSGYHSLSLKIMRELNVEMMKTELNQIQLLHQLELHDKNRKSLKGMKKIYPDDEAILSPVAKRAHRETFKVINKLREKYGEFDSIVIETTRDKNSDERRKRLNESQKFNENINKQVNELLNQNGFESDHINSLTKLKVRLYLEQDGKTAYTQKDINLNLLINDPHAYEVDHIIPISISLDDSYSNKVLVSHIENQEKSNMTPIQTFLKGKFTGGSLEQFRSYVRNNKNMKSKKKGYLLSEKDITKFDNIQEFINRNLVDTSYACRTVMNTLQHYFKDNEIPTKVHTIKGQATNTFRKNIHLEKERDNDYYHHAIDALIVASLKKLNLVNSYLMKYDFDKLYDEKTGELFEIPEEKKYLDPEYISFVSTLKNIYEESYKHNLGLMKKEDMHYPLIKISHKIDTKPNRQISDETIYSTRNVDGTEMLVERIKNIYDPKEKAAIALVNNIINNDTDKYIMVHKDPQTFEKIKEVVISHFNTYKDSKEYYTISKGKYELKSISPLTTYYEEFGPITKYSKKNNGPAIQSMKFYSEKLGNHISITNHYKTHNKKVIMKQISPYRTDFYVSSQGKYKFVTVRYKDVFYKASINKYVIDEMWYHKEKMRKGIEDDWKFVCSMHRDELIGIVKKEGSKYIFDAAIEKGGVTQYHDGVHYEILKFTATNNDDMCRFEVKPIACYCKKQLMPTVGTCIKIAKFATDVLGNMYEIKENVLKLEFE